MKIRNGVWRCLGILLAGLLPLAVQAQSQIVINLPSRTLSLYADEQAVHTYPVAIGSLATPTPLGEYQIIDKEINPAWYPPGKNFFVPSGPENPLGYRWMGFLPTYGIHGTNAPWSIGGVVSNGCIRMCEEDVEALYEQVEVGTPVSITYNRYIVQLDQSGYAFIELYPDVYARQPASLEQLKGHMAERGLTDIVPAEELYKYIMEEHSGRLPFARLHTLSLNGADTGIRLVSVKGIMVAPVMEIAGKLSTDLEWDAQSGEVRSGNGAAAAWLQGQTLYVSASALTTLFGGAQEWHEAENRLDLRIPLLQANGHVIANSIRNEGRLVAVKAIAAVTGQRLQWDAADGTVRNAVRTIPTQIVDGEPYIATEKVSGYFHVGAVWHSDTQILKISDEQPQDVSMYLDLMGTCK